MGKSKTVGPRPVVAFRVHHDLYELLCKEAKLRKLSVSEEAARRLASTFK